jgi:hypothetical protein
MQESFSFTVRPVQTHRDLLVACRVRAQAYGHKIPEHRDSMLEPDDVDRDPRTRVYLCQDKLTGKPVGTMRVQARHAHDPQPLAIERHVTPPKRITDASRAEITRLAAPVGADPMVRLALWKTGHLFCVAEGISWLLMGVRKPSLIRAYEHMGAQDLFGDGRSVPLAYAGNLDHRVMVLDIDNGYDAWKAKSHRLLDFMFHVTHPDIVVSPRSSVQRRHAEEVGLHVLQ